ncbi:GreA/GreB family elongation factor [Sphingobacterium sp. DN00404]|uniref:GreA/GreB family elongation factor n=1 Tax=Sphingobacterium micropteri TaxID=2763501 RepID=A0ABR7YMH7_9SPHI|nr:GreA/GreB family elongation factor [Sphingobacterium micropteri]MBD1432528.1 GreA/GreB family elongation factor [Sphingobacterium micropteri]
MDIGIKKELLNNCLRQIEGRLEETAFAIQQAQEAIESETKSSAGDKYETSREMIQQDLNRYHTQLLQSKKDWVVLQKMETEIKEKVEIGAIVVTEKVTYFMAVSLGQQLVEGMNFMVISPSSPIGKLLLGREVGDQIVFNGTKQSITAVY